MTRFHGAVSIVALFTAVVGTHAAAGAGGQVSRERAVTFSKDVAPIIYKHCGSCHNPSGEAPFSLLTYQAARQRAGLVASVVKHRQMPPWPHSSSYGEFVGLPQLSPDEVTTIQAWAAGGAPEGDPSDLPPPPTYSPGWQLGTPDLVVTLSEPYALGADGQDEFRTFVVPVPIDRVRSVRGLELRPEGARTVIHHANVLLDSTDRSRLLDEADPLPGFDGPLARTAVNPDGHFLGYAPGRPDPLLPSGLSWELKPGDDLVVQLHLSPSGKTEHVRPLIGLYFSQDAAAAGVRPLVMRMGRRVVDIRPGDANYVVQDTYATPTDLLVLAIKPHAHYLARSVSVTATSPDGGRATLLAVPAWSFRWQNVYRFAEPVSLARGTELSVAWTYDNSAANPFNPSSPPRRVLWGPSTIDEMGDVWIQVQTPDARQRARLADDFGRKEKAEDARGYEELLGREPGNSVLIDDIALLYLELGRPADAARYFEESVRLRPDNPEGHFNLATALASAGQADKAERELEEALRLKPEYGAAHTNLANLLSDTGRGAAAESHYVEALRLSPSSARALNGLAVLRMSQGAMDQAELLLQHAIASEPGLAAAHLNLAIVAHATQRLDAAALRYREALRLQPASVRTTVALAWLLATAPDDSVRNGREALQLASEAGTLTAQRDAGVLEALAAAQAAIGEFAKASVTVDLAMSCVGVDASRRARLLEQQSMYREGRALHLAHPLP